MPSTPNILILGATSDIGVAIARKFGSHKYDIHLAGRNINHLEPLKKDLTIRYDVNVEIVEFDACNFNTHIEFYDNLTPKPDITVCTFGYLGDQKKAEEDWKESQKLIATNYLGAVSILNIIANDYEQKKQGTIVGISSVAGERGRQSNYLYGSSKAGFTAYLSGLRNRLYRSRVHVMSVLPGFVYTKMTENMALPPRLTAHPEDVASVIYRAVLKKKNVVYVKWYWRIIILVIKMIPENIFKKMSL